MASRRRRPADEVVARFGNRIVGHGTQQAGQFLANPENWRIHPRAQQEVLTGLLEQVGFVQSVIVNKRTHESWGEQRFGETLVDGHLRVELALSRGEETDVPVAYVDLTQDEERAVLASIDPISAMATTDRDKLDALVSAMPDDLRELTAALRAERKTAETVTFQASTSWRLVVECDNEGQRESLRARLSAEGYRVGD